MSNLIFRLSILLGLLIISSGVQAAPGGTSFAKILSITVREDDIRIHTEAFTSTMDCPNKQIIRIRRAEHPNYNAMVSAAFSAYAMGKPVAAWINVCDAEGMHIADSITY